MAKVRTKELFDLYYASMSKDYEIKTRGQAERPELYEYEKQIGKQLIDMNANELIQLFITYNGGGEIGDRKVLSYRSIDQITSIYRNMWNFYIENIDIIINPWNNKKMKGMALFEAIAPKKEAFTYKTLEKVMDDLYKDNDNDFLAKYVECIILLYYHGFENAAEIINLKENMIRNYSRQIIFPNKVIKLSDHAFELLEYVHNLNIIHTERGSYKAIPYNDGYFKIIVRPSTANQINTLEEFCGNLNRKLTMTLKRRSKFNIGYKLIYFLGFYDYIVAQAGEERAKSLVYSERNSDDAAEIMQYAKEYGVVTDNVSYIKRALRTYV